MDFIFMISILFFYIFRGSPVAPVGIRNSSLPVKTTYLRHTRQHCIKSSALSVVLLYSLSLGKRSYYSYIFIVMSPCSHYNGNDTHSFFIAHKKHVFT